MKFEKLSLVIILLLVVTVISCKKDEVQGFDQVLESGGRFDEPVNETVKEPQEPYSEERGDEIWRCTTEKVSVQQGAGGNSGYPLFSPNSGVIFPGNLLQGASLHKGTPDIVAVKRAGGVISTDVIDGNIEPQRTVDEITKGNVSQAVNDIIANSTGIVPANFSVNIKSVHSEEQFALALGLDVNTTFYDVSADLNYESSVEKSSFLVSVNQSFYTMSFDIPTSVDEIFEESVTPADLEKYVGPGNPATYISDVTYGRVYYMMITSSSSSTEMSAAINASFNGLATQVEGNLEIDYMKDLEQLEISVFAYGGKSSATFETVGEMDLSQLKTLLGEASDIRSGKAISYVVRSVYDNQIVATQLATDYDVTNCVPIGPHAPPPYTEHWTGEVVSRMGPIGAAFCTQGTEFVLISEEGNEFMISRVGELEGPYSIDELGNEACTFDAIGAACNIDGNNWENPTIMIIDKSGTQYHYLHWGSGNYVGGGAESVDKFGNGVGPFAGQGYGALAFLDKHENGPSQRYMFNRNGDQYVWYNNSPQTFKNPEPLTAWGVDHSITQRINGVGAAIGFELGSGQKYHILFNKKGTQYVYYGDQPGTVDNVIGPFDL